jgi:hypothetical protein
MKRREKERERERERERRERREREKNTNYQYSKHSLFIDLLYMVLTKHGNKISFKKLNEISKTKNLNSHVCILQFS